MTYINAKISKFAIQQIEFEYHFKLWKKNDRSTNVTYTYLKKDGLTG